MDIPLGGSSFHCLLVELEFGMLVLWKEENQRHRGAEKNPQSKHMNQQQTQPTCTCDARSAKPNPGHTSKR